LCKKNIVPSSQVEGPLTISRLYNVTFEQALDAVLGHGFKYEQDGDFVRVYTAEEFKKIREDPERMIHKVLTLYYITAEEAAKLIQPVLSAAAKIQMTTAAQKQISSTSSTGGGSGGSLTSSGGGDDLALNDMIVVFDYPENIEKAEGIVRQIDVRPKQVLIEATIMSALLKEGMEFVVDWNLLSGVMVDRYPALLPNTGTPWETTGFAYGEESLTQGLRIGFSSGNVQAFIVALENITDTTLLANPKILAVNKQEGSVLIGRNLGYASGNVSVSEGGVVTQEVEFLQTGTQLVFRPYIGNDGYIRMDIYPKDSDAELVNNIPDEKTTELKTNIIVKDGETVVIGGLFRDVVATGRSQVPVLGNLPMLGALFRGTTDKMQREEVIIMLTPHIIEEPSETNAEDRARDIRLKQDSAKHNLQGIDRARLADDAYARASRYYLEGDVEKAMYNLKMALMIRPTYLEALRLRERIIAETDPAEFKRIDSIVREEIDEREAKNWRRH
jgi:type IV pilus assembly protein PilQ